MADPSSDQLLNGSLSTDLVCEGDLTVQKDILPGCTVRVGGTLTVHGIIMGSEIAVSGNCSATGGIVYGDDKGRLVVKGHLKTARIERAAIECDKSVHVDGPIIRSMVKSKETVFVTGAVEGGEVSAIYGVTADTLGYAGQAEKGTQIEAGMNYRLKVMLEEMDKEIADIDAKTAKIRDGVTALENKGKTHYSGIPFHEKILLKSSRGSLDTLEKQLAGLHARREKLEHKLEKISGCFIEVKSRILPGTCLCIQHRFVVANKEYPPGRYTIGNDKICRL